MRAADVRRRVLAAVERGELPRGGPSELAARDLTADVAPGYWDKWSSGATRRIRAEAAEQHDQEEDKHDA